MPFIFVETATICVEIQIRSVYNPENLEGLIPEISNCQTI